MAELGERVAALDARFESFERYEHDRWHKLANDLQPLIGLPVQMARDIGKLEGSLERTVAEAVGKAVQPVSDEVAALRADVEALKASSHQFSGARMLAVWFIQTVVAAAAALGVGKILFGGP